MSIASAIQNAQQKVTNAYTAVNNKGGTLPVTQNLSNLPTAISSIPDATEPTLASLTITPSTTAQTLTPPSNIDGYNTVSVSAVTSAIDSDIQAGNIKSGVNILGVTGTVTALAGETRTVSITSTSGNTFTPSSGKNGITSIKCNPTNKALTITPTTTTQTLTVPSGYSGYGTVTCGAGTQPSGTYTITANGTYDVTNYASADVNVSGGGSATLQSKTLEVSSTTPTISTISPDSGYDGLSSVTLDMTYIEDRLDTVLGSTVVPTGTITITANGTYDVTNYASADVNVPSSTILTTKNITQNGTYNASSDNADGYSSVTVNVSGGSGIGITREVSANGVYQIPSSNFTFSLPSNATNVGSHAMYYAFYNSTGLTSVDLSSLTTVSGSSAMQNAFYGCTGLTGTLDLSSLIILSGSNAMQDAFHNCRGLTSVDLSSLTTVSGSSALTSAFYGCTGLTSADLSSLTTLGSTGLSSTFYSCTNLTSVSFNNLQTIGADSSSTASGQFYQCFYNCTKLTSLTFPKLEKIYCTGPNSATYLTFYNNNKVQKMYFPKLDTITYGTGASTSNQNACKNVFNGCSALTELHFAAANQSAIEASPGYSTAWGRGAGNVTIYFDL